MHRNGEICLQPTLPAGVGFKKASATRILLLGIVPVTELVRTVNDFECAHHMVCHRAVE